MLPLIAFSFFFFLFFVYDPPQHKGYQFIPPPPTHPPSPPPPKQVGTDDTEHEVSLDHVRARALSLSLRERLPGPTCVLYKCSYKCSQPKAPKSILDLFCLYRRSLLPVYQVSFYKCSLTPGPLRPGMRGISAPYAVLECLIK